jgi:glutamate racemase
VLAEIRDRLPYEHTVYFGDTARVPYGIRDLAEVRWFTFEIINYLIGMNVKLIVIACNTATASALRATQRSFEVPIIGVIEPGARAAVEETRNRRVGVLATPLTAASGAYRRAVHSLDAGIEVNEQACPEFVPMIERGVVEGPELEKVARGYLEPIMERMVDAVVLGCTHYPLISAPINRILGPEVRLISSAGQTALEVGRVLSRRDRLRRPRHVVLLEVGRDRVADEDRDALNDLRRRLDAGQLGQEGFQTALRLGGSSVGELRRILFRPPPDDD